MRVAKCSKCICTCMHAGLITREAHYLYTLLCQISKASEVCMDHTDTARSLTG